MKVDIVQTEGLTPFISDDELGRTYPGVKQVEIDFENEHILKVYKDEDNKEFVIELKYADGSRFALEGISYA